MVVGGMVVGGMVVGGIILNVMVGGEFLGEDEIENLVLM